MKSNPLHQFVEYLTKELSRRLKIIFVVYKKNLRVENFENFISFRFVIFKSYYVKGYVIRSFLTV